MNVNYTPEQGKACLEIENAELRKENQRLNNDIKVLLKENEAKEKVIIKQDNVLNELEEWLEEDDEVSNISFEMGKHFNYKDVINKIYELK